MITIAWGQNRDRDFTGVYGVMTDRPALNPIKADHTFRYNRSPFQPVDRIKPNF